MQEIYKKTHLRALVVDDEQQNLLQFDNDDELLSNQVDIKSNSEKNEFAELETEENTDEEINDDKNENLLDKFIDKDIPVDVKSKCEINVYEELENEENAEEKTQNDKDENLLDKYFDDDIPDLENEISPINGCLQNNNNSLVVSFQFFCN